MNKSTKTAGSTAHPVPLRLGYYLGRHDATCYERPDMPYRGVDRLPYIPSPEECQRLLAVGRGGLARLWDRYYDAAYDEELAANLMLARELQREFLAEGIHLDIAYAEIAHVPPHVEEYPSGKLWAETLASVLPRRRTVHDRLGRRPDGLARLGYDSSHPVPTFHSAIAQPNLHERTPGYCKRLNENGLFEGLPMALAYLSEANAMDYGPMPFCLLEIWEPVEL